MAKRSPKLQFTPEERAAPELKKSIKKADKAVQKLEKAEAKLPEKTPSSKLSHTIKDATINTVAASAHHKVRDEEDENVGVESAHGLETAVENGARTVSNVRHSSRLKPYRNAARLEKTADRANIRALNKTAAYRNRSVKSNPRSRWQQKRAIKKSYAAAKTRWTAANMSKTAARRVPAFVVRHRKSTAVLAIIAIVLVFCSTIFSSCAVLFNGLSSIITSTTYPSKDEDMLAAEAQYCAMESDLQALLDNYETSHDYDEYRFELDDIEHDPYVLISILTALKGGVWKIGEVQNELSMLFEKQYTLTETVTVEVRYETETRTDADGESYEVEVPYDYYVCTVKLENFDLSHVPIYIMDEDTLSVYAMYMSTLGNRPDLFPGSDYVIRYYGTDYTGYRIPPEALEDEQFAAMITEAEKYLGFPYVWGGASPSTSFDCSGFVSWVINHCGVGWNFGRLTTDGLYFGVCTPISPSEAKPGDLIFFEKTYNTPYTSHIGIYVGNGMMIHCGNPIQYASINTAYFQSHFYGFGRLPAP